MSDHDYFILFGIIQLLHSQEEIWTGFHKRWFVFKMPRWIFITFELALSFLIIFYMAKPSIATSTIVVPVFALAMLINGVSHIVWATVGRSYVPGLVTAPLFVVSFCLYYFNLIG